MRIFIVVLWFILSTVFLNAAIDEYKSDVYFANGINTSVASGATTRTAIKKMYETHNPTFYKHVNEWKVSVNHTEGMALDLAESYEQKMSLEWWGFLYKFYTAIRKFVLSIAKEAVKAYAKDEAYDLAGNILAKALLSHDADLKTQVESYKKSIRDGHGVIVLAHSQGNLFTLEAFEKLDFWMKPYFHTLAIASPGSSVPNGGPHITFNNDAILAVPSHMESNVKNPTREIFWLDPNAQSATEVVACPHSYLPKGEATCSVSGAIALDTITINAHYISYYLSYAPTRDTILKTVDNFIDVHLKASSQWFIYKIHGCPGRCDQRLMLRHGTGMSIPQHGWQKPAVIMNEAVIPFIPQEEIKKGSHYGKLHRVPDNNGVMYYTKTDKPYAVLRKNIHKDGICQLAKDAEDATIGELRGEPYPHSKTVKGGVVGIMLTWDMCYPAVDLDLDVGWDAGYLDVHDDKSSSFEHFVIESEDKVFPRREPYKVYAHDKTDHSQIDPERIALEDPIDIAITAYAPGTSKVYQTKVTHLSQLELGHIMNIYVKRRIGYPQRFVGGNDGHNNNVSKDRCDGDKSCGCIPCSYKIVGFLKMALLGPISDGAVKVHDVDHGNVIYTGRTKKSESITEAGIIDIPDEIIETIKDDTIYLIEVAGGEDIDANDDLYTDDIPTRNSGTLHAIVTGKQLKYLSFKVNILTEIAYQVSKDLLGKNKQRLIAHLDDVAQRIFTRKVYTMDGNYDLGYNDLLVWIPGIDKEKLKKDYDTYVQPIVKKVYADKDRLKASYDFVYTSIQEGAPQIAPFSARIATPYPAKAIVGNIKILDEGDGQIEKIILSGEGAQNFAVDPRGVIKIAEHANLDQKNIYTLQAVASNENNHSSTAVNVTILTVVNRGIVDRNASVPYPVKLELMRLEENAAGGTEVAKISFVDQKNEIVGYQIHGADSVLFDILPDGTVVVAYGAQIDYEKKKNLYINVSAINSASNASYPLYIVLPVINKDDTPVFKLFFTKAIEENVPIGSIIGELEKISDGDGDITHIDILNPRPPFAIDADGVIRTIDYIDFETNPEYTLIAVARSTTGDSNRINVNIHVEDIEPEEIPQLGNINLSIEENISAGTIIGTIPIRANGGDIREIRAVEGRGKFDFDFEKDGRIKIAQHAHMDYEHLHYYDLKVVAYGEHGASRKISVFIQVTNIPDTPPTINGFTASLKENRPYSGKTAIGKVRVLDPGEGDITSYGLSGADSGLFEIDTNGTVMLKEDTAFDYEVQSKYTLYATASNVTGASEPVKITLYIEDAIDSPPHILDSRLIIAENAAKGTRIGNIAIPSIYKEDNISYKITKDDLQALSIDLNGTVTLAKEGVLDYEKQESYDFELTASNRFGTSTPKKLTIKIINTGTAPKLKPTTIAVPFDRDLISGLQIGVLNMDRGDGTVSSIVLDGNGSAYFTIDNDGNITLNTQIEAGTEREYNFRARASNEFGTSSTAAIHITFEAKPKIRAGSDMAVFANKAFTLHGEVDEAYRDRIKEIRWHSPETDKINCSDSNITICEITQGLLTGEYEAIFTVVYQNGWQQSDSMMIKVEPDPLDNVLSIIEKPLKGLKQMKLSKDRTKIYAVGDFEGDDIVKIIDVSDPENMQIIASFAYGDDMQSTDIALNNNETKAAVVADGHLVVVDISDPTAIHTIASRYDYWHQYAYGVEWYKNNQIIINNWGNHGDYMDAVIVDADTMDINQTIRMRDGWVRKINVVPDKALLVYPEGSLMKIYDINQHKIVYEGNNTYTDISIGKHATQMIYKGTRPVYEAQWDSYVQKGYLGLLDISDTGHISEHVLGEDVLYMGWGGDIPYYSDAQTIALFSSGSTSVIKELNMEDREKPYIEHVLPIRGDIKNIQEDKIHSVVYVYTSDGLEAISTLKQSAKEKFTYRFKNMSGVLSSNGNFLYLSQDIYDIVNLYKPVRIGTFDIRKSCYPDCGSDNLRRFGVENAKIIGDQVHIVSSGVPIDYWVLDLSDKNQTISLHLPPKYDDAWSLGSEFAISSDMRYIYTRYRDEMQGKPPQGLSVLDTQTNQQKDFVFGNSYSSFESLIMSQNDKYLYTLFDGNIYLFDIQDKSSINILTLTEKGGIKAFALSQKHNKLYAFSDTAMGIYDTEVKNILQEKENIALPSTMLNNWQRTISLSPNENKIMINTKYGLRLYQLSNDGFVDRSRFMDIYYPGSQISIAKIVWIDNMTFVAGGYMVILTE